MRALRLAITIAVVMVISLAAVELLLRLVAPRLPGQVGVIARYITTGQPYSQDWTPAWRENRDHYYTLRPNIEDSLQYGSPSVAFHLTTHKLWDDGLPPDEGIGFRTKPVDFGVDVVVVGDSFGFCFTEQADCWVDLFAAQTSMGIVNLSTPVTGSLSHAKMAADFAAPLEPPLLIWQFFGNDFYDDYGLHLWRGDIEEIEDGNSADSAERGGTWLSHNLILGAMVEVLTTGSWSGLPENEIAYQPQYFAPYGSSGLTLQFGKRYELTALDMSLPANQYGLEQTRQAMESTKTLVESWGGQMVVVMIPTREEVYAEITGPVMGADNLAKLTSARETMHELCDDLDLLCLDPTDTFAELGREGALLYYADDMHLNAEGNAALADLLDSWLDSLKDSA